LSGKNAFSGVKHTFKLSRFCSICFIFVLNIPVKDKGMKTDANDSKNDGLISSRKFEERSKSVNKKFAGISQA